MSEYQRRGRQMEMVLGFAFDDAEKEVVLIQKQRPEWQKGYLNGIGGKVEKDEQPYDAMVREFKEETGITCNNWQFCGRFSCDGGLVYLYKKHFSIAELDYIDGRISADGETINKRRVDNLRQAGPRPLDNLHWIIPLLLDNIQYPFYLKYNSRGGCKQEAESLDRKREKAGE